jgi:hypothetical protein
MAALPAGIARVLFALALFNVSVALCTECSGVEHHGVEEFPPPSGLQVLYQKQAEWSDWTMLLTAVKSRHDITALHIPRSHRRRSEGCYVSNFRVQEFALGDANGAIHIWEENGRMLWSGAVADGLAITSITSFCTITGNRIYLAAFSNKSETGMISTGIVGIEIEKGSRKPTIYNIVQTYDKGFNIPDSETQATLKTLYAWCPKGHRRRSQVVSIAGITIEGSVIFGQLRIETAHSEDSNDMIYSIDWFYKRFGRFDQYGAAISMGIHRDHPAGRVYVLTSSGYVGTILPRHYLGGSKTMSHAHIHMTRCPFEGGKNVTIVQSKFDRHHLSFATLSDAGRLQVARLSPRGSSCSCVVPVDEYVGLQRSMNVAAGYILTVNSSGTVAMYNGSTGLSVIKETTLVKLENVIPRSEKKSVFQFVPWFPPWSLVSCAQKDLKVSRSCLDITGHLKEGDVLETADVLDDAQLLKSTGLILVRPSPSIVAIYSTWLPPYNLPRHHPLRSPVDHRRHNTHQRRSPQFHILTQLNWVGLLHPILIAVVVAIALRRNRITKQETDLMLKGKHRLGMVAPPQPERSSWRWERISRTDQDSSDSEAGGWVPTLEGQSGPPSFNQSTIYNQPRESEAETFQRWKHDTFRSERRLKDRAFSPREKYSRHETQAGQDDTIETIPLPQQHPIDRAPIQTERAPRLIWD